MGSKIFQTLWLLLCGSPLFLTGQTGCPETFVKGIGNVFGNERGYSLAFSPDKQFLYLGGLKQDSLVISKITLNGDLLWWTTFDVVEGLADHISTIFVDGEGMIGGCGIAGSPDAGGPTFLFRFDPLLQKMLWSKVINNPVSFAFGMVEKSPGGNYLLCNNPQSPNDAELLEFDRNTGALVPAFSKKYHLGNAETVHNVQSHQGALYGVGRYTQGSGFGDMRHALTKFDLATGTPIWSRLSHVAPGKTARLYGSDLIIDDDAIISIFSGEENGAGLSNTSMFVQKTSLDGNLLWLKKIDLPDWPAEFAEELVAVADGYVLLAHNRTAPSDLFLIKITKNGALVWARTFDYQANDNFSAVAGIQNQLLTDGNFFYFTGFSAGLSGLEDALLAKVDKNGRLSSPCAASKTLNAVLTNVPNPVNTPVDLVVSNTEPPLSNIGPIQGTYSFIGTTEVCGGQVMTEVDLGVDLKTCKDTTFTLRAGSGFKFYLWQDGSTAPTLTVSTPGVYWVLATDSCDMVRSDTIVFRRVSVGKLDLGPNVNTCADTSFVLKAGGGFESYLWQDGSTAQQIAVSIPGVYWVQATDSCGNLHRDTMVFQRRILDGPNLGPDLETCRDTMFVLQAGTGFQHYSWSDGTTGVSLTVTKPGVYWVQVVDSCGHQYRDSMIYRQVLPLTVSLPSVVQLAYGDSVQLVPFTNRSPIAIQWSPENALSNTTTLSPWVYPKITTQYKLVVADTNGCLAETSVLIEVVIPDCLPQGFYIPNAFSPESGTSNTIFTIFARTSCIRQIRSLNIYTRWGEHVFLQRNFPPDDLHYGWDGNFRGKPLLGGVYVYVFEIERYDSSIELVKGNVTLLR